MPKTTFEVDVPNAIEPGQTLLVGLSSVGTAGYVAADYLVRHSTVEEIGHISPSELPAITPFEDGRPRQHTRLYNLVDADLTVLVGELFVPVWAARPFADILTDWVSTNRIEELAVLHSVPYPHGPDDHRVFHVATEAYHDRRLESVDIPPLSGGYLDGVPGEFASRSLDETAPPTGVYATPTHPPGPDIEAALRLLDALETVYGISVDLTELEDLSDTIRQQYENLAERIHTLGEQEADSRDLAIDRMYM